MVAGGHALVVYPTLGWATKGTSMLQTLCNGSAAVAMFFVLSGLVLGMGLQRQGNGSVPGFFTYTVRRIFRIYPVLFFTTAGILLFLALMRMHGGPGFWFNHVLPYRQSVLNSDAFPILSVIIKNLLALHCSLNLVTWTLGVEMASSLLLPLAHYARVRMPSAGKWLLLAAAGVLCLLGKWFLLLGWVRLEGAFNWDWFSYFYLFYLGSLLPVVGPQWFARLRTARASTTVALVVGLYLLLSADWFPNAYALKSGVGAWLILGVMLFGFPLRPLQFLDWPVVRFFGLISYSFYLLHDLVLITCARLSAHYIFQGHAPASPLAMNLLLMIVSIAIAAALAKASHRWIELPFIQAGRQLAGKILAPRRSSVRERSIPDAPLAGNIPAL